MRIMIFFGTFNNRAMNVQFFFQSLEALKKKKRKGCFYSEMHLGPNNPAPLL